MQTEQQKKWQDYILTPTSKQVYPESVKTFKGRVERQDHMLKDDRKSTRIIYQEGAERPYLILDIGPSSCGGYPAFKITSQTGNPTLRISYADWYDHIVDETYGETGDFLRGTCTYLGVELPVLPANPNRFEQYTITEPGVYFSPLLQGQQRWVRIQLDTPGSIEIEWFRLSNINTYDNSAHLGYFLSSDEDINLVWYASTWTSQLASIPNSNAWEIIAGWLAPRYIECGPDIGLCKQGNDWFNYLFSFSFSITRNPAYVSSVGWVFCAKDEQNGYVAQIDLNSRFHLYRRSEGLNIPLKQDIALPVIIHDNKKYGVEVRLNGDKITTFLNGIQIDSTIDNAFTLGTVGFYQPKESWAAIKDVIVLDEDRTIVFAEDFSSGHLDNWSFTRTLGYVSDGAKRDRLLWSGDLDWASRNIYYALDAQYMKDSIKMMALNQTPEGYIHASPYPGQLTPPESGEYGPFPSDEFSAWFVPVVADYLMFTGDYQTVSELYPAVCKDLDYLLTRVDPEDGLFNNPYETSKHIINLDLGDVGKYSFVNLLLWYSLCKGAFIADKLGDAASAKRYRAEADVLNKAINEYLWDEAHSCFKLKKDVLDCSYESNALALYVCFVSQTHAEAMSTEFLGHGKIAALAIRGKLNYRLTSQAVGLFRNPGSNIDWISPLKDWRIGHTTSECMFFPEGKANGSNWGDKSHPDTAIADIFTGYLLGIRPSDVAYARYEIIPQVADLTWAEGKVPTPNGDISYAWQVNREGDEVVFKSSLTACEGTIGMVAVPKLISKETGIWVNGVEIFTTTECSEISDDADYYYIHEVQPGTYVYELRYTGLGKPVIADRMMKKDRIPVTINNGAINVALGKSVLVATSEETVEIEIDLERDQYMRCLKLYPRTDIAEFGTGRSFNYPISFTVLVKRNGGDYQVVKTVNDEPNPIGKPVSYDLITAVGNPFGRFVRIVIHDLGVAALGEEHLYRLSLAEVEIYDSLI